MTEFLVGKVINCDGDGKLMTEEEWEAERKKIADSTGRYCYVTKVDRKTKTIYIEFFDSMRKTK